MKLVDIQQPDIDYQKEIIDALLAHVDAGDVKHLIIMYERQDGTIEFSRCASSSMVVMGLCNLMIDRCCRTLSDG